MLVFRYMRVYELYKDIVIHDIQSNNLNYHRKKITALLAHVNKANPYFRGTYQDFLSHTHDMTDAEFFTEYAKLPINTKDDYRRNDITVMDEKVYTRIKDNRLRFDRGLFPLLSQIRRGNTLFSMATGGSTSMPLSVEMDKQHAFAMLFTFFKCWYRMGWRPGDKILIFYPNRIYDLEHYVKNNHFKWLTGFEFLLFDAITVDSTHQLIERLATFKPKLLLVFPSTMNQIAHIIHEHALPLTYQPPLINVSGETFFDCQRKNIARVFPASLVQDSYGSVELGEIAHESSPSSYELFNTFAYAETVPTTHGKAELVATIHYSTTFPFIRYRMGDFLDVEHDSTGTSIIKNINGKTTNYISLKNGIQIFPLDLNECINGLNRDYHDAIVDVKLTKYASDRFSLFLIISKEHTSLRDAIARSSRSYFAQTYSIDTLDVQFVDIMDHDYRLKYRVIEDTSVEKEFAGGIIGQTEKLADLLH